MASVGSEVADEEALVAESPSTRQEAARAVVQRRRGRGRDDVLRPRRERGKARFRPLPILALVGGAAILVGVLSVGAANGPVPILQFCGAGLVTLVLWFYGWSGALAPGAIKRD